MPKIDFIGYITNDLFSVLSNVPDDIYIMKSDFTIYNARTKQPILNVPNKFLFFNILTNNLYKVSMIKQCLRYISNNQTYTYEEYKYNYIQADGFWSSTDPRRTDYLGLTKQTLSGYTYILTARVYDLPLTSLHISIDEQVPFNNPTFTSTINMIPTTANISNINLNPFGFDVQLDVQVDSSSNYVQFNFYINDSKNLTLYSITKLVYPEKNTNTVIFSFNSVIFHTLEYPFTMGLSLGSDSKFSISNTSNRQFRIFT